jgi:hypothetical protein
MWDARGYREREIKGTKKRKERKEKKKRDGGPQEGGSGEMLVNAERWLVDAG